MEYFLDWLMDQLQRQKGEMFSSRLPISWVTSVSSSSQVVRHLCSICESSWNLYNDRKTKQAQRQTKVRQYKLTLMFSWFVCFSLSGWWWCIVCSRSSPTGRSCYPSFGLWRAAHSWLVPLWPQQHQRCLLFVKPLCIRASCTLQ